MSEMPEELGNRRVFEINYSNIDQQFMPNSICTGKYTCLTFLPKNLFLQITKMANFYFLLMGGL